MPASNPLQAAVHPDASDALFFVATGGGDGSTFSTTLAEHNLAVNRYYAGIASTMITRGKFITIEGIEGAGKHDPDRGAARLVAGARAGSASSRASPAARRCAERIRELLLTPTDGRLPMTRELLLMFAARATHIENLIRPALERGAWVVCDRFTDATYAYQGDGRGVRREEIVNLERYVQAELRPDLTLLLDAPIAIGAARAAARDGGTADRFAAGASGFFRTRAQQLPRTRAQSARPLRCHRRDR